jgi:hypothetical protein
VYELRPTTVNQQQLRVSMGWQLALSFGFLLASTSFSFFPWKMEQKLALFKENVLLVLELIYSSSWVLSKIQAMNEALKKEVETKVPE